MPIKVLLRDILSTEPVLKGLLSVKDDISPIKTTKSFLFTYGRLFHLCNAYIFKIAFEESSACRSLKGFMYNRSIKVLLYIE